MEDIIDYLKIPKARIAVLIGKGGEIRRRIEKETGIELEIDSEEGEVKVTRKVDVEDPLLGLRALDIIKAIGRGFAPQKAFKLLNPNIYIQIIDLSEHISGKSLLRVRARIIGKQGKARSYISKLSETDIAVYGKTVGVIGESENVGLATEAVMMLIKGVPHNAVFRFLERKR